MTLVAHPQVITAVQTLHTMCIHGLRPGDSSTSICGWKLGPATIARGKVRFLTSIASEAWENLCDRRLMPERTDARAWAGNREDAYLSD